MKLRMTALAAGISLALTACGGGGSSPTAVAAAATPTPKVVAPVAIAPTSEASAPVAASTPPANDPTPTPPAPASAPTPAPPPASAPIPASTPTAPPPQQKAITIEIYGDDSMLGIISMNYGMPTVTQQTEPNDTQTLLRAQFGDGITVVNKAEGGLASTLVNMMNGVDGGGPPFAQRMATSKADIVLMNHAINDDLEQSLAPYADAMVAWVQVVRAAGKIPVLEEPNPVCDGNHPYLNNYVATMDGIAQQYSVPLVKQFDYIQTLPNWQTHLSGCFYPDEWLLRIKAQQQAAVLTPIVQKLIGN